MHGNEIMVNKVGYTTMIMKLISTSVGRDLPRYFDRVPLITSLMVGHIHQIC